MRKSEPLHERQINDEKRCPKATLSWTGRWRAATGGAALLFLVAASAAWSREALGAYRSWAAFGGDGSGRCHAVSAPRGGARGAFAAVTYRAGRAAAGQIHVRFGSSTRTGSAVLLTIDDRLFQLVGRGPDAWAGGAAADRAIVAGMRTGVAMTVSARDGQGRAMTSRYPLAGAASALDAAAIACRRG